MRSIFIGPLVHWLLILLLIGLGWLTGSGRLHVIEFNLFIAALLALTAVILVVVIRTSDGSTRITRDPIDADD